MNIPLLRRLSQARGSFVSWGELGTDAERLRADLDALEAFGFPIERHPYGGVAYRGPAERLCPDQIEFELGTRRIGRRIAVWNRVTSTNDLAVRGACSRANDGLVVLAEEQTEGRGSRGRRWVAPAATCVLMSVLLFPPDGLNETGWLTALGAVAVAEVVSAWTGREPRIKWPNDVRVAGRKIAGVLVERGPQAVIGIGLNANLTPDQLPDDLRGSATSLRTIIGERVDRSELIRDLIRRLDVWYDLGRARGAGSLSAAWSSRSEHLGQSVSVLTPSGPATGVVAALDLVEGIELRTPEGPVRRIALAQVLELAPRASGPLEPSAGAW